MKLFIFLTMLLLSGSVFSQGWIDSIRKARQLYLNKEYDKAQSFYLNSEKNISGKPDLSDEIAQNYYRKKKYDAASTYFNKRLSKCSPQDQVRKLYNLGNSYEKQQKYTKAIDAYKKALKIDPFHERARYNLSQVLRKMKNNSSPKNQKNPEDKKNKDQNKDQKKQNSNPPDKKQKPQKQERSKDQKPASTRKNAIDRMLKNLLKQEAKTKSKLNKLKEKTPDQAFNGKDW
ncbi:MAG: hypothetical protein RIT43_573 [Bacteroidota bacterium]|jgi:tetratricopeptide (TPR) repeat protein